MQTNMKILRTVRDTIVVCLEIKLKQLVGILPIFTQALQHVIAAEVRQSRIIDLDIPQPLIIKRLKLLAISSSQIREEIHII